MERLFSNVSTHWRISANKNRGPVATTTTVSDTTENKASSPQNQTGGSQQQKQATASLQKELQHSVSNKKLSAAPVPVMSRAKAGGVTAKPVAVRKSSRKLSTRMDSEVIDAFRLFDRDKDGRVTKAEIIDLIESLDGDPKCPQVKELIEASEKNDKGSIDQSEFMTLWIAFKAKVGEEGETEAEIKTAFKEYDLDGDGYITKDEMVEAITKMGFVSNTEEEAGKCLKEMDLDGDGKVSYAEFMVKWKIT